MAVEYTWDIQKVEILPTHTDGNNVTESDVIAVVHYEYMGLDSAKSDAIALDETLPARGVVSGVRKLNTSDLSGFTSFANVTKTQVATWVEADIGSEMDQLKAEVDKAVTENATPVQKTTVVK